jgi:hypothetical protein
MCARLPHDENMIELRKYAKRIQDKIGETKSADGITEGPWWETVVKEINQMSIECARELEKETGRYPKPGYPDGQPLEQAPPTRILAHTLILSFWLGWVNNEKGMDLPPFNAWDRLQNAYKYGRELSKRNEVP